MADASVTLDLDAREFDARLAAIERSVAGGAKRITGSFNGIGAALSSQLGGVISAGAISVGITKVVEYGTRIQDLSDRFGVGTTALQKFGNAAEKNGSSLESVAMGFGKLEKARSAAMQGDGGMTNAFLQLGVSMNDLQKMKIEDLFLKIGGSSMKAAEMIKLMGRSSLELRPFMAGIADGTIKLSGAIAPDDIAKLKQADDLKKDLAQKAMITGGAVVGGSIKGWDKVPEIAKGAGATMADTFHKAIHGRIVESFKEATGFWRGLFGGGDKATGARASDLLTPFGKATAEGKTPAEAAKAGDQKKTKRDFSTEDADVYDQLQEASKLTLQQLAERDENNPDQTTYRKKYIGGDIFKAKQAQREKQLAEDAAFAGNEQEYSVHNKRFTDLTAGIGSLKESEKNVGLVKQVEDINKNVQTIADKIEKPANR
jgi:hypothetical protein